MEEFNAQQFGSKLLEIISYIIATETDNKEPLAFSREAESTKDNPLIQESLDSPLGSAEDLKIQKIIAAALVIAKRLDILPEELTDLAPNDIANVANQVWTNLKVCYQVATGELDITEAADVMVDNAATRLVATLDSVVEEAVPVLVEQAVLALATLWHPLEVFAPVAKDFARVFLSDIVKNLVHKGSEKIKDSAHNKDDLRNATERIRFIQEQETFTGLNQKYLCLIHAKNPYLNLLRYESCLMVKSIHH